MSAKEKVLEFVLHSLVTEPEEWKRNTSYWWAYKRDNKIKINNEGYPSVHIESSDGSMIFHFKGWFLGGGPKINKLLKNMDDRATEKRVESILLNYQDPIVLARKAIQNRRP